ncbi:hypothetical protein HDU92_008897 [Lobulomyces angularis]|nr:hypothetical protein HDU92_008897 [Lobulomyces angularis]
MNDFLTENYNESYSKKSIFDFPPIFQNAIVDTFKCDDSIVVLDSSVYQAVISLILTDPVYKISGYLGGFQYQHPVFNKICTRICHLIPAKRNLKNTIIEKFNGRLNFAEKDYNLNEDDNNLLLEEIAELKSVKSKFSFFGYKIVGWYKSVNSVYPLKPTNFDICKHAAMENLFPHSVCLLLNVLSLNLPSVHNPIHPPFPFSNSNTLQSPVFNMFCFITNSLEITNLENNQANLNRNLDDLNSNFVEGVDKVKDANYDENILKYPLFSEHLKAFEVDIAIFEQLYYDSNVLRETQLDLMNNLNEFRQLYTAQSYEYPPQKVHIRSLLDSSFDTHLSNFYRHAVGESSRQIDAEYQELSIKVSIEKNEILNLMKSILENNNSSTNQDSKVDGNVIEYNDLLYDNQIITDTGKFCKLVEEYIDQKLEAESGDVKSIPSLPLSPNAPKFCDTQKQQYVASGNKINSDNLIPTTDDDGIAVLNNSDDFKLEPCGGTKHSPSQSAAAASKVMEEEDRLNKDDMHTFNSINTLSDQLTYHPIPKKFLAFLESVISEKESAENNENSEEERKCIFKQNFIFSKQTRSDFTTALENRPIIYTSKLSNNELIGTQVGVSYKKSNAGRKRKITVDNDHLVSVKGRSEGITNEVKFELKKPE